MLRVAIPLCLAAALLGLSANADAAPKAATLTLPQAQKLVAKLAKRTARLRQLRLRRRIKVGVYGRRELVKKLRSQLTRETNAAELAANEAVLKRLGLLGAEQHYREVLLKVLGEQVVGRYDLNDRKLYLSLEMPVASRRSALVHEICHALQAQNLRLKRFTRKMPKNSDRRLARMALVEGDCTGLMVEDALRGSGVDLGSAGRVVRAMLAKGGLAGSSPELKKAPLFIRRTLTFPYEAGLRLVQRIRRRGSWRRVSRYFRRPLETTEQILHPAKLRRRERPISVRARKLPALTAWRMVKIDTFGELLLSVLLERHLDREIAARAAAGWGGDRLVAYVPGPQAPVKIPAGARPAGGKAAKPRSAPKGGAKATAKAGSRSATPKGKIPPPLVIHLTAWDTAADAMEFHNALLRWARARFGAPLRRPSASSKAKLQLFRLDAKEHALVERHRRQVLLIVGAPSNLSVTLRTQIWARWRISGRKVSAPAVE